MINLSDIYNANFKKNRGKAAEGFIRPTLGEYFVTHKDFTSIMKSFSYTSPGQTINLTNNTKSFFETPGEYLITVDTPTQVLIKMWGGAGGAKDGGVGGYTEGTVTLLSGNTYLIWVGGGGRGSTDSSGSNGGFGGGGLSGRSSFSNRPCGSGGGLSGLFVSSVSQANAILIAGAGGGSARSNYGGGNGGGLIGGRGPYYQYIGTSGGGGSQKTGGLAGNDYASYDPGNTSGSVLNGGKGAATLTTKETGGGGGSGYFGGGGGGGSAPEGSPGGGGSAFIHETLVSNGSTIRLAAYGGQVPNSEDDDYKNNTGMPVDAEEANPGLVVINKIIK